MKSSVESILISKYINESIDKFGKILPKLKDKRVQIYLDFYATTKSFVWQQKDTTWERWTINLKIKSSTKLPRLIEKITNRMIYIIQAASEKTDHVPPLKSEELWMDGCYPFKIIFPEPENTGFMSMFKFW